MDFIEEQKRLENERVETARAIIKLLNGKKSVEVKALLRSILREVDNSSTFSCNQS